MEHRPSSQTLISLVPVLVGGLWWLPYLCYRLPPPSLWVKVDISAHGTNQILSLSDLCGRSRVNLRACVYNVWSYSYPTPGSEAKEATLEAGRGRKREGVSDGNGHRDKRWFQVSWCYIVLSG